MPGVDLGSCRVDLPEGWRETPRLPRIVRGFFSPISAYFALRGALATVVPAALLAITERNHDWSRLSPLAWLIGITVLGMAASVIDGTLRATPRRWTGPNGEAFLGFAKRLRTGSPTAPSETQVDWHRRDPGHVDAGLLDVPHATASWGIHERAGARFVNYFAFLAGEPPIECFFVGELGDSEERETRRATYDDVVRSLRRSTATGDAG